MFLIDYYRVEHLNRIKPWRAVLSMRACVHLLFSLLEEGLFIPEQDKFNTAENVVFALRTKISYGFISLHWINSHQ